jgi:hypothetical protein
MNPEILQYLQAIGVHPDVLTHLQSGMMAGQGGNAPIPQMTQGGGGNGVDYTPQPGGQLNINLKKQSAPQPGAPNLGGGGNSSGGGIGSIMSLAGLF